MNLKDWEEVYQLWNKECLDAYPELLKSPEIFTYTLEVVKNKDKWERDLCIESQLYQPIDLLNPFEYVGWFPLEEIKQLEEEFKNRDFKHFFYSPRYDKGKLKTAAMFIAAKNNPEKTAVIWLCSSIWEVINNRYYADYTYYQLYNRLLYHILLPELDSWINDKWHWRSKKILPFDYNPSALYKDFVEESPFSLLINICIDIRQEMAIILLRFVGELSLTDQYLIWQSNIRR